MTKHAQSPILAAKIEALRTGQVTISELAARQPEEKPLPARRRRTGYFTGSPIEATDLTRF